VYMTVPITNIATKIIKNSRGHDTIAVTVHAGEHVGTFAVPEGASTGSTEVAVIDPKEVSAVIETIVAPALVGTAVVQQTQIDTLLHKLDTTERFTTIGGNVALGVSVAALKAASKVCGVPVWQQLRTLWTLTPQAPAPRLFINLINGGKHAQYGSPIQEHQIVPQTDDVQLAYNTAGDVQVSLERILIEIYGQDAVGKGDEGGFIIPSQTLFAPFEHLRRAIAETSLHVPVALSCDIAASSFFVAEQYQMGTEIRDTTSLFTLYAQLHETFPELIAIEDPFFEKDLHAFTHYKKTHPQVLLIGDDLTTTNKTLLQNAIAHEALSGIIIKPNQIGTVTDTLETMALAYTNNIKCIVSHRSGETLDDFIADLAYATGAFGLKAGAPHAPERDIKYQRLIQIQQTEK
jgi:enolase